MASLYQPTNLFTRDTKNIDKYLNNLKTGKTVTIVSIRWPWRVVRA